ncbi:Gfo/Idh/MocA family protein [Dactylosporangium matsuzakiense]|uniref:Oxidoreductase n=1 Tax=Dactylosporangium matsuzakiense TaxID=53360 RepID=A0A9W6NT66_9ACTN|nr:Gfo/Idh/MocA family oxidoreductase [Dactylosporangium matsuzakiense]UWZ42433.1 Gfo/Idh/MocA family oxidoreductase [Dactylosporangium matsuzakiense]GLL08066.1 oxidoreductase [Dactylosporangium matsuzakiense]
MRVAVVGPNGYGLVHRRAVHRLAAAGRARLVALAGRRRAEAAEGAPVEGVPQFTDVDTMLTRARPDIVVIATPPHARAGTALAAAAAGADLLIEKPAVRSSREFAELTGALQRHGVAAQVGFQALGSASLGAFTDAVGDLRHAAVAGAWWRPDAYFTRADWAGRRRLGDQDVVDGAIANQFSHGVMQGLAVLAAGLRDPLVLELERYRSHAIEVEDTACLRLTGAGGVSLLAAVTVSSDRFLHGELVADGARLAYPADRYRIGTGGRWHTTARVPLLDNLLDHRADRRTPLVAGLARTETFTRLLEAVLAAPPPTPVPGRFLRPHPDGGGLVIDGVLDTIEAAVTAPALFSELGVAWARAPHRITLPPALHSA